MALSFLINIGCRHGLTVNHGEKSPSLDIKKIALIGFEPASYLGKDSDEPPNSVSEGTSLKDSIILEKCNYMNSILFEVISGYNGYEYIIYDRVDKALPGNISSGPGAVDIEILGSIAGELQCDVAVIGYLFRWREREGSDYAVSNPASVGFDLYLVDPEYRAILWKGRFNKTQSPLSENLLDIRTFIKGKGKWMTADNLASLGMNDLVEDMFKFINKD